MADIGSASLLIVPKFDGLGAKVNSELGRIDTSESGSKMGKGVSNGLASGLGGLVKGGAIMGAFSAVTSAAMDAVSAHVGDAAARLDTMKNYPRVMSNLGVSSGEASASIQTMSDRLSTLPTRLDDMAATVQGLYATTKSFGMSLTETTDAGLGLNDMLLAGGQGTQVASAAMEQFRQMLSKGKPDMQDWKALVSAAPAQMDQLAQSMLGPTANANDLYEALGGGKHDPTISMSQLLAKIAELDSKGGAGLSSFREQAETATGGVQTAAENFSNAWTKGIASVMDAFGQENIAGAINMASGAVRGFFDVVAGGVGSIEDFVKYSDDGANASQRMADAMQGISGPVQSAAGSFDTLGETVDHAMARAKESQEKATEAHHKYLDQLSSSANVMQGVNAEYQSQVSSLEYAGQVIDSYAGKTGLSVAQQDELKRAIDTVNSACGTQYKVMEDGSGIIDANTGVVQDNTDAIWDNIRAQEAAAKAQADMSAKIEQDKVYAAAVNDFQAEKQATQDSAKAVQALVDQYGSLAEVKKKATEATNPNERSKESAEALDALKNLKEYTIAMRQADIAQRQAAQSSAELAAEQAALEAKASGAELTISQLAEASDVAAQAFNDGGSKASMSIMDFGAALEAAAADDAKLKEAMSDPETMAKIVAAYDGTAESLQGVLDEIGVGYDETAAKAADAQGTVSQMGDWLIGLGDDAYAAFALMGLSADDMAAKLSEAGVTMDELSSIGAENFTRMAEAAGGDVNKLVGELSALNAIGLDPKTLTVNDDGTITDESGKVWDLNAQTIDGKHFTVNDDGTISIEGTNVQNLNAQQIATKGFVITDNGTAGQSNAKVDSVDNNTVSNKDFGINAHDNATHVINWVKQTLDLLHDKTINITTNYFSNGGGNGAGGGGGGGAWASGGVRLHADGGAIYTGPTMITPHDVIGEAGAEYYDGTHIVPLTNRRYSQPFADIIADEVANRLARPTGSDAAAITAWLDANLGPIIAAYAPDPSTREMRRAMGLA